MTGLKIDINKDEFCDKPNEEQHWMLYEAVTYLDIHGCAWERKRFKAMYPVVFIGSIIGGMIASIVEKLGFKLF